MLEEKLLIWKLRRGNLDALRQIYDRYKTDLLKMAVSLTGDVGRAEDAVQDVFLKMAEVHRQISIQTSLKKYLAACLVNRIRSLHRSDRRHEDVGLGFEPMSTCPDSPERWAVLNEQMRRVGQAMAQLPPEQREAVTLRIDACLRFGEIARIQNVSTNTVQGRYRYGMEKLRSLLNGEVDT